MFSVPQIIAPVYAFQQTDAFNTTLNIGSAVKDLPESAETAMKEANDLAIAEARQRHEAKVAEVKRRHDADTEQYERDFRAAQTKATYANSAIDSCRNQRAIAITVLVVSIVAVVGVVIAAVLTQTWPILFIAAAACIAIVPSSYFTHILGERVDQFEEDIEAPKGLQRPELTLPTLSLPTYDPTTDLDLKQSRIDAQNGLAAKKIYQISTPIKDIIRYALLDRVVPILPEKRSAFYADCIQLIQGGREMTGQYQQYRSQAKGEHKRLDRELRHWKSQEESRIAQHEATLRELERPQQVLVAGSRHRSRHRRGHHYLGPRLVEVSASPQATVQAIISRHDLSRQRSEIAETFGRRDAENRSWYTGTKQAIQAGYDQAMANLEMQYLAAKTNAVTPA